MLDTTSMELFAPDQSEAHGCTLLVELKFSLSIADEQQVAVSAPKSPAVLAHRSARNGFALQPSPSP